MNPLSALWNLSLAFLAVSVAIVAFPFTLLLTLATALAAFVLRQRRQRRYELYGWPAHDPRKRRASGYRRARYGRFYA